MRRIRWTEAPDELAGTREGGKMDGAVSLESAGYVPVDRGGITFLLLSIDRSSYRSALLSFYSLSLRFATFSILPAHLSRVSWYFSGVTAARCSLRHSAPFNWLQLDSPQVFHHFSAADRLFYPPVIDWKPKKNGSRTTSVRDGPTWRK